MGNNVYAIFQNRMLALNYFEILKKYRISAFVVNKPNELGSSCGIAIKFNVKDLQVARSALGFSRVNGFKGFFIENMVNRNRNFTVVK